MVWRCGDIVSLRELDDHLVNLCMISVNIFFFQAEDGIRDWSVTGVQTCALPICSHRAIEVLLLTILRRLTYWTM